jgi:hypothetical protein
MEVATTASEGIFSGGNMGYVTADPKLMSWMLGTLVTLPGGSYEEPLWPRIPFENEDEADMFAGVGDVAL